MTPMPSRRRPKVPPPRPLTDVERFAQSVRDSEEADRKAKQDAIDRKAEEARLKLEAEEQAGAPPASSGRASACRRARQGSEANGQGCCCCRHRLARGEGRAARARDRQATGVGCPDGAARRTCRHRADRRQRFGQRGRCGGGRRRLIWCYNNRRSVAQAVSSWRFESCSLRSTDETWVSTVFTETWIRAATSL